MLSRNIFWPSDIRQGIETQLRGSRMFFLLHFCRRFLSRWQLLSRNILWPSDIRQGIETHLRGSRILFLLHFCFWKVFTFSVSISFRHPLA